jgi:hypothetical protein
MQTPSYAGWMLEQEARALLTRLARVKPFALQESMLPAANLLPDSQLAIEKFLMNGRRHLRELVKEFLLWLRSPAGQSSNPEQAQRRFTILRLRFNAVITHFDMFDNVITQRSENEIGLWLSGLDVVSADALLIEKGYYEAPPVICYLDRGIGAAIRRARTRMPGGGDNPVAIIKVPRERMVGSGIASSLVHEVGHQAAALLDLVESLRPVLEDMRQQRLAEQEAWQLWKRWISEIVADFWSIARVGIASTLGLIGVVSLPRAFVFRLNADDPHPTPWIRVKLSAAIGQALYPQPAWEDLVRLWESYYPIKRLSEGQQQLLRLLENTIPSLVEVLVNHRPKILRGRALVDVLDLPLRDPARLRALLDRWRHSPKEMYEGAPTIVFAAIGQGRIDGRITPEEESVVVGKLLGHWALLSTLQAAANCVVPLPASAKQCGCHASTEAVKV